MDTNSSSVGILGILRGLIVKECHSLNLRTGFRIVSRRSPDPKAPGRYFLWIDSLLIQYSNYNCAYKTLGRFYSTANLWKEKGSIVFWKDCKFSNTKDLGNWQQLGSHHLMCNCKKCKQYSQLMRQAVEDRLLQGINTSYKAITDACIDV